MHHIIDMALHLRILAIVVASLTALLRCPRPASAQQQSSSPYAVRACVVDAVGGTCDLEAAPNPVRYQTQPVRRPNRCEDTVGQRGSLSFVDLTLPPPDDGGGGGALLVEVTTSVAGQSAGGSGGGDFFVRPSRVTEPWGAPTISNGGTTASFYIADAGQFSVEFAPSSTWRDYDATANFDALLLFVNPTFDLPPPGETELIQPGTGLRDLGPNGRYRFGAGLTYDWGEDVVFHVHDGTEVYFEQNSYVRARIVQTTRKVDGVKIAGYGVLDNHYPPAEYDVPGETDDGSRQAIHVLGRNVEVFGLTIVNTNEDCAEFGYALNVNANWAPLITDTSDPDVFMAGELQDSGPPYKPRRAHCQENNMDDTPNVDFDNCPTSRDDGARISFVKAIGWQMGQDGINGGKFATVSDCFVRVADDAIKPWDLGALYTDIVIWQLPLGWPINLGWWGWTQGDEDTVVDGVSVIHNQNWMTSGGWPETASGQCVVGGIYGSSAVKSGYRIRNIYVETACSCAVGLEISDAAFSRHLTPEGCVGSIKDLQITNMFFDEEFYMTGGYNNFLRGERTPNEECTGDYAGEISNMVISGSVNGRDLTAADFTIPRPETVPGLVFQQVTTGTSSPTTEPTDPPSNPPTKQPTNDPTDSPTGKPTFAPVPQTPPPSPSPTPSPTPAPTASPVDPTPLPSSAPTQAPTHSPTDTPVDPTPPPSASPTPPPTPPTANRVTVQVVIENFIDPSEVTWKIKVGTTDVASGRASGNYYQQPVELDAGQEFKFAIIDRNFVKDTFYEIWDEAMTDVLIWGDDFGRKDVNYFTL